MTLVNTMSGPRKMSARWRRTDSRRVYPVLSEDGTVPANPHFSRATMPANGSYRFSKTTVPTRLPAPGAWVWQPEYNGARE